MSLIAHRPTHWNEVVGQGRVTRVLHGVLRAPEMMTRGFIFSGVHGLGKTTVAYLFARALMCVGANPLLCRDCPSCEAFVAHQSDLPDFDEVDAASHSGVDAARSILQLSTQPAQLGRRRVILIDEAHRLSEEAWDVYLKPLELADTEAVFLFVTNEVRRLPKTILRRCTKLALTPVTRDEMAGLLTSIADRNSLSYTADGIRSIVNLSQGKPGDAINMLGTVGATGAVTPESCRDVLVDDLSETARKVWALLARSHDVPEQAEQALYHAIRLGDEAAQVAGVAQVINALFQFFARAFFEEPETVAAFPNFKAVTQVLLKWSAVPRLPSDVIPLVVMELSEQLNLQVPVLAVSDVRKRIGKRLHNPDALVVEDRATPASHERKTQQATMESRLAALGAR